MVPEDDDQKEMPDCPDCGGDLGIAWIVPRMAHLPEIRTFRCEGCKALFTDQGEPDRPLNRLPSW